LREGQAEGEQIRKRARLRRAWRVDVSGEVLEVEEKTQGRRQDEGKVVREGISVVIFGPGLDGPGAWRQTRKSLMSVQNDEVQQRE
jgi:hypothetical protein